MGEFLENFKEAKREILFDYCSGKLMTNEAIEKLAEIDATACLFFYDEDVTPTNEIKIIEGGRQGNGIPRGILTLLKKDN